MAHWRKLPLRPDFSAAKVIGVGVDSTRSQARCRSMPATARWAWTPPGAPTRPRSAGCGRTIRAGARRPAPGLAAARFPQYIAKCGGTYSSEWFWAKIWHCLKVAPDVFSAAHSWWNLPTGSHPYWQASPVSPADQARGLLPGTRRSMPRTGAGCRRPSSWRRSIRNWRRYGVASTRRPMTPLCPPEPFAASGRRGARSAGRHPDRDRRVRRALRRRSAAAAGKGTLVKVIGTSTCDCAVVSADYAVADIPGICGIVKGAILPGFYGIEAGRVGRRRHLRGGSKWCAAAMPRCDAEPGGASALHRNGRTAGAGLEQWQPHHPRRPAPHRPHRRACSTASRAEIYRALIEATRLRRAGDRRAHPRLWRAHRPRGLHRRPSRRRTRC